MKLKICRVFSVFLIIASVLAYAVLLYLMIGTETLSPRDLLIYLAFAALVVTYGFLVYRNWAVADRQLLLAVVYAGALLLVLTSLGF
jgi:hypothetical protein